MHLLLQLGDDDDEFGWIKSTTKQQDGKKETLMDSDGLKIQKSSRVGKGDTGVFNLVKRHIGNAWESKDVAGMRHRHLFLHQGDDEDDEF